MEIQFENQTITAFEEFYRQTKRCQIGLDSVVPDVNDDIGRIASVQSMVLLKNKEQIGRGAFITGEVQLSVLYITETGNEMAAVKMSKEFNMDFELGDQDDEVRVQVRFDVANAEARAVNPRKISVTLEVSGELSAYHLCEIPSCVMEPDKLPEATHLLQKEIERSVTFAVCEKSAAFQEQYPFPDTKGKPLTLLSQQIRYDLHDAQQIGSRLVVKGDLELDVYYQAEGLAYPVHSRFHSPFSQILEIGQEGCEYFELNLETTSAYFELADGAGGGKVLEAEIHALVQVIGRSVRSVSYIADAYSNRVPVECMRREVNTVKHSDTDTHLLQQEIQIPVAEDCSDILCIVPTPISLTDSDEQLTVNVGFDIIYFNQSGEIMSVRRNVSLPEAWSAAPCRVLDVWLESVSLIPNGCELSGSLSVRVRHMSLENISYAPVYSLSWAEDQYYEIETLPSLTLVFSHDEDLWALAKKYHASPELISSMNESLQGLLLIPREN